ncbi:hypothetical protein K7432_007828 [Basidiobolus ranarum]|uniref:Uncharacterized protein n=1 Tax=Basidiobolus ranarum TaxID=34480 RepID=A0ABR2WSS9_9FUNG
MTEPKALSEHNESQTQLSVNNQKSPQLPPPSKSFKTPSPSFVSKIPIPARLVKERSPNTSPTGLLGFKSPLPEQKEHWRQHRPLSSPTLSNSSGEESPLSKKQSSNKVDASTDNMNDTTDDEETNISKNDTSPTAIGTKEGTSIDTTSESNSYLPTDANDENSHSLNQESVQPIFENKEGEEGDTYPKGGLKVRFDDNSPEKIASYWDSIAEPINKTPNTTPFYKSPLANTVNFDESTTENEDSVFMEEISYVSDSDDIRTYRPSFLDETSFMSEIDHSSTSIVTMEKEATVQKFFAGLSESEFTIYESSQFDSSIKAEKQSDLSTSSQLQEEAHSSYLSTEDSLVEPKNLIRLEQTDSTMNIESSEEDHRDSENIRESHPTPTHSEENIKPNVFEPSELRVGNSIVEVENAGVADEVSQSGTINPESSENILEHDEESYSEVVNQSQEIKRQTGESSEISETEQTVPVRAESPEDAEQTVPGQVINTNSLGHPNKSYADAVSSSLKHGPNEDESKMESTPQLEPSTTEDTMDNSWPLKFPLPNTPFGQEASTQIDNDSGNYPEYHSEITWNYNESLDRRDELSQRSDWTLAKPTKRGYLRMKAQ